MTNIEEFCKNAGVARGTLYNYYNSIEDVIDDLSNELGDSLFAVMSKITGEIADPAERIGSACRYYWRLPMLDPVWAWAMVNTSLVGPVYGRRSYEESLETIKEGMSLGQFSISSPSLGRDIVIGTGLMVTLSILRGGMPDDYPDRATKGVLQALGLSPFDAQAIVEMPLSPLDLTTSRPWPLP